MVLYSSGDGVVTNVSFRHRNESLPTITIHVAAIYEFVWIIWYVASRSILTARMRFDGYFRHMDAVIWKIQSMENP